MTEEIRCATCGARNTPDADWCTQCFTPLAEPTPEPEALAPAPPTAVPVPPAAGGPVVDEESRTEGEGAPRQLKTGGGQFRETEHGLEWVCAVCQEWNSIDRLTCQVCSTPFGRRPGSEEKPKLNDVPPALLTIASLVVPGAGHLLLGLRGAGILRAFLGLIWGLGGLSLFLQARASGQSFLPAIPLLLGWAVVAAGSANDAVVEAAGSGQRVLQGRVLLWLTLAVVGGTFAAVLVGVLSAVGG